MWQTQAFRELNRPLADVLGDKTAKAFLSLNVHTVGDLMRHVPRRYFIGTELSDLSTLQPGQDAAIMARVVGTQTMGNGPKQRLEATITDGNGTMKLTFFGRGSFITWWERQLNQGDRGIFVGKVGAFNGQLQLTHPTFVMLDEEGNVVGKADKQDLVATVRRSGLIGLYPATAKLPTWTIAGCAEIVLNSLVGLNDPWPEIVRKQADLPSLREALVDVHHPKDLVAAERGRRRLLFDEAFATQLTMANRRVLAAHDPAIPRPRKTGGLLDAFDARLPFTLTAGQQHVGEEIFADLAQPHPMQRLLQGEVGSGKTLVALRAMLAVVDAGGQAALLAPTEVLATQHAYTLRTMLGDLAQAGTLSAAAQATQLALLTGSATAAQRREAHALISSGDAGIVVGTHALLSDAITFADLGLVVIDEQHRFGVEQRAALQAKAAARPHVLVMTATPIPRTVAMTIFADLAISNLTEIPAGRADVSTTVVDERAHPTWVDRAWQRVCEEVANRRQAFIVAPKIGQGAEPGDGASVVDLHAQLTSGPLAGVRVGLLHGQLSADIKEATMRDFAAGKLDVLIATTVIEVGVDVPNATMMVICDADRFGISQLHQLRGRIGRGQHEGVCLLLTQAEVGSTSRERLDAVAATRDGFLLADIDLVQRREGDVLGTSQAGSKSSLRLLSITDPEHVELIQLARHIADEQIRVDPDVTTPGFADAIAHIELVAATLEN